MVNIRMALKNHRISFGKICINTNKKRWDALYYMAASEKKLL